MYTFKRSTEFVSNRWMLTSSLLAYTLFLSQLINSALSNGNNVFLIWWLGGTFYWPENMVNFFFYWKKHILKIHYLFFWWTDDLTFHFNKIIICNENTLLHLVFIEIEFFRSLFFKMNYFNRRLSLLILFDAFSLYNSRSSDLYIYILM